MKTMTKTASVFFVSLMLSVTLWGAQAINPCVILLELTPEDETLFVNNNGTASAVLTAPYCGAKNGTWAWDGVNGLTIVSGGGPNDSSIVLTSDHPTMTDCGLLCSVTTTTCSKCKVEHNVTSNAVNKTWIACPNDITSVTLDPNPLKFKVGEAPKTVTANPVCSGDLTPEQVTYKWTYTNTSGAGVTIADTDVRTVTVNHAGDTGARGKLKCEVSVEDCPKCHQNHIAKKTAEEDVTVICNNMVVTINPNPVIHPADNSYISVTATADQAGTKVDYSWTSTIGNFEENTNTLQTAKIRLEGPLGGKGTISCGVTVSGCKSCGEDHSGKGEAPIKFTCTPSLSVDPHEATMIRGDLRDFSATFFPAQGGITYSWSTTGSVALDPRPGANLNDSVIGIKAIKGGDGKVHCEANVDECAYCGEGHSAQAEATVKVAKIDKVEWYSLSKKLITEGNDHPDFPIGIKYDPGAKNPKDKASNNILAKISFNVPLQAGIRFRMIDVDDPSNDVTIDPNKDLGEDNHESFGYGGDNYIDPNGIGFAYTDKNGEVYIPIILPMCPGDNLKLLAMTTGDLYNDLLRTDSQVVRPDDQREYDTEHSEIVSSNMLTAWRTLHVEIDSMEQEDWDINSNSPDITTAIISSWEAGERWGENRLIHLTTSYPIWACPKVDFYRDGYIEYMNVHRWRIISNTCNNFQGDTIKILVPDSDKFYFQNLESKLIVIHDDDGGPCRRTNDFDKAEDALVIPKKTLPYLPTVSTYMQNAYKEAYVDVVDLPHEFNLREIAPFDRYTTSAEINDGAYWNNSHDVASTQEYWNQLIVCGFQWGGNPITGAKDMDPNSEIDDTLLFGANPGLFYNWEREAILMTETIRDFAFNTQWKMSDLIEFVMTHESAHAKELDDYYDDESIMDPNVLDFKVKKPLKFNRITINKIRQTSTW